MSEVGRCSHTYHGAVWRGKNTYLNQLLKDGLKILIRAIMEGVNGKRALQMTEQVSKKSQPVPEHGDAGIQFM